MTSLQKRREEKAISYGAVVMRPQSIYSNYPAWTPQGNKHAIGVSSGRLDNFLFLFPKEVVVASPDKDMGSLTDGCLCFSLLYSDLSTSFVGSPHSSVVAVCVLVKKKDGSFGVLVIPFVPSLLKIFFRSVLDGQQDRVCFDFKVDSSWKSLIFFSS